MFLAHSVLSTCSNSTLLYQLLFPDWEAWAQGGQGPAGQMSLPEHFLACLHENSLDRRVGTGGSP